MLQRHAASPAALSHRASSMRRLRRRAAANQLYCSTNGCASFLEPNAETRTATCPICGYRRRLS